MRFLYFVFITFFCVNIHAIDFKELETEKGIKFWFVQDNTIPLVSMSFSFDGGMVLDPTNKEGSTNLMTSLLDEGTQNFSSLEYKLALKESGTKIFFTTDREKIDGTFQVVSSQLQRGFWLLQETVNVPLFNQKEISKVKKQIEASIKIDASNVPTIASDIFNEEFFLDEKFSRKKKGTLNSLKKISRKDIKDSFRDHFNLNTLVIGVSGDISEVNVKKYIDYVFGDLPRKKNIKKTSLENFKKGKKFIEYDTPQSSVVFGQRGLKRQDDNYFAARIANYILGGGSFQSRLYKEIREKNGLVYSIRSYLLPLKNDGLVLGFFQTRNENVDETLRKVIEEWDKVSKKGVTKKEFKDAKTFFKGSFSRNFTNTLSIASLLKVVQYYELGNDYFSSRDKMIDKISLKQVNKVAGELFNSDSLFFVIVGKKPGE